MGRLPPCGGVPGTCDHMVGATGIELLAGNKSGWSEFIHILCPDFRRIWLWDAVGVEIAGKDESSGIELFQF